MHISKKLTKLLDYILNDTYNATNTKEGLQTLKKFLLILRVYMIQSINIGKILNMNIAIFIFASFILFFGVIFYFFQWKEKRKDYNFTYITKITCSYKMQPQYIKFFIGNEVEMPYVLKSSNYAWFSKTQRIMRKKVNIHKSLFK